MKFGIIQGLTLMISLCTNARLITVLLEDEYG